MEDQYGRKINYMRISVTDRCNLRCVYCMPEQGVPFLPMEQILTYEEIVRICRIGVSLGITRIKLTGGEPLVRKGITDLVGMIRRIPEIQQVTMTTNGVQLAQYIRQLKENGLDAVNISLDTLDRKIFQELTRFDRLDEVKEGISAALQSGIKTKLNVVLQEGCRWKEMIRLAEDQPLDVRFIEVMPLGEGRYTSGISADTWMEELKKEYPDLKTDHRSHGNGPAEYFQIPGFQGCVGIIHAMHGKFCKDCNRIRITSSGRLKPCLCYSQGYDLRTVLRGGTDDEVREVMKTAIWNKPEAHCFEYPEQVSEKKEMSSIGG